MNPILTFEQVSRVYTAGDHELRALDHVDLSLPAGKFIVVLGVVVLYNLGVMSYTERYREMATLKVVGFRDRQIGRILIGQNLWLTVLGVIIGLPAGVGVLQYLIVALASEYEMKLTLGPLTYTVSIALTFGVSLVVGWMISRKNRKINMVEALKGVD